MKNNIIEKQQRHHNTKNNELDNATMTDCCIRSDPSSNDNILQNVNAKGVASINLVSTTTTNRISKNTTKKR